MTLRTPMEWAARAGFTVLDPDGWRADGKSFEEPIAWEEFTQRCITSTLSNVGAFINQREEP